MKILCACETLRSSDDFTLAIQSMTMVAIIDSNLMII